MAGTLTLTFNSQPTPGNLHFIGLRYLTSDSNWVDVSLRLDFVETRVQSKQVAVGTDIPQTVLNYISAVNLDYGDTGGQGNVSASLDSSTSLILSVEAENWEFTGITGDVGFVDVTTSNSLSRTPRTVKFTGYDQSGQDCNNTLALFEVSGGTAPYNVYVDGSLSLSDQASPIAVPVNRNTTKLIRFTDSADDFIGDLILKIPRKLITKDINISTGQTSGGATVIIDVAYVSEYLYPLQYSLDNVTFSETNSFTGQANGDYTIYVKDAFGCVISKDYTVDETSTLTETIFQDPSEINPFRFSKVEPGKLNRYNTLSYNQNKGLAYTFSHLVVDGDEPVNQIKTNAKYLSIYAVDCQTQDKTVLNPVKRSDHIGRTFKSTATQFATDSNLLGLFFGAVNILDPTTDAVLDSKDFGYQIPTAFDKEGRLVEVSGFGLLPVQSIIYDENYEAFVLQFNVSYTGAAIEVSAKATYNIQNYEIYEFITPVTVMPDSFQVVIEAGRSENDISHAFISERIEKTVDSKELTEIVYWNTTNIGSMNYATGITHKIRLHSVLSRIADEQTVEGYNGDVERYNTSQELFDGEEYIFGYLSDEMVRKVRAISTHNRLFINGVLLRLKEAPELNSRFSTNLCELTALFSRGGDGTENFDNEIVQPITGEGVDEATYQLENAVAAAKNKALILWKK